MSDKRLCRKIDTCIKARGKKMVSVDATEAIGEVMSWAGRGLGLETVG